jgi:hypothetical protein
MVVLCGGSRPTTLGVQGLVHGFELPPGVTHVGLQHVRQQQVGFTALERQGTATASVPTRSFRSTTRPGAARPAKVLPTGSVRVGPEEPYRLREDVIKALPAK